MQYAKTCLKPDDTSFIQLRHPTAEFAIKTCCIFFYLDLREKNVLFALKLYTSLMFINRDKNVMNFQLVHFYKKFYQDERVSLLQFCS